MTEIENKSTEETLEHCAMHGTKTNMTQREPPEPPNKVLKIQQNLRTFYVNNRNFILQMIKILLVLAYAGYFGYAMYLDFQKNIALFVLTICVIVLWMYEVLKTKYGAQVQDGIGIKLETLLQKVSPYHRWVLYFILLVGFIVFLVVDMRERPNQLISLAGLFLCIVVAFLLSNNKAKILWRQVIAGLAMQFIFGLIILRWNYGLIALRWVGQQVALFISYTDAGARFVFGEKFRDHSMAFQSMPATIFFGAVIALLFYFGAIQFAIVKIGWLIQSVMGTGTVESYVAAANIFFSPTESVVTVGRILKDLTSSEISAIFTCGLATIAGAVMALYITFGVSASHLVSASVMSAPAALAISKIIHPETDKSKFARVEDITFEKSNDTNAIEAFSNGASAMVKVVAFVLVNMIGFIAGLQFLNMTVTWFGERVGVENLTLQGIWAYIFMPLGYLMGVAWADCYRVGELIGKGIFINSFLSYLDLGQLIRNRENGVQPFISQRSEAIVTYAVCNFANFGSVGMNLGSFSALAPCKKTTLSQIALKALVGANLASFMTACIAGLLYTE
ncbi:unnamed protein product [Owenia fusiformis]|uniref:Sodium/nucleoside cotransporter n=1 Tax=Owenia fusiformis TaxID=6347 RepID=A0A8S4N456_OWEFU|nr:unnamed protein product [Owenia fusiformis]